LAGYGCVLLGLRAVLEIDKMKRWAIFTVIAVIVSVCLVSSYAGININSAMPRPGILGSQSSSRATSQPTATARSAYPVPRNSAPPLDPNVVYAAIRAYPGLDKQLEQVGRGSRTEIAEWRRLQESLTSATAVDTRSRMTREVQKQVALELGFLRKVAEEEGAKKTIAAIDGVLLYRQSRLDKLNKQLQEDRREAKANASSTRSSRTRRSRTGGTSTGTAEEETTSGSTRRRR